MGRAAEFGVVGVHVGKIRAHQDEIAGSEAANVVAHVTLAGAAHDQGELNFRVIVKGAIESGAMEFE
jgi:hypothetical protein